MIPARIGSATTSVATTFSYTIASGTDRCLLVAIHNYSESGGVVNGVSYGGVAMTQVGSGSLLSGDQISFWRLLNPPVGTANVTLSTSNTFLFIWSVAQAWQNVHQTTPFGTAISSRTSTANPSVNVATAVDDVVFGMVSSWTNQGYTVTPAGTQLAEIENGASDETVNVQYLTATSTPTTPLSWTFSLTPSFVSVYGVAIKGTAGSGGSSPTITSVDSDNSITSTQTGVAIAGTSFSTAEVTIIDGSIEEIQSINSQTSTSINFNTVFGNLRYGTRTLRVTNADDEFDDITITITAPTGVSFVDLTSVNSTATNRITAVPDLAIGDQIEISNVQGGTISNVTINTDATFNVDDDVTSFDIRINDGTGWGSAGTQYVTSEDATPTPTVTATPTVTPTRTGTPAATPTSTVTPTRTNTITPTRTLTPTPTTTVTFTPTQTASPTVTPTITTTPTITPTPTKVFTTVTVLQRLMNLDQIGVESVTNITAIIYKDKPTASNTTPYQVISGISADVNGYVEFEIDPAGLTLNQAVWVILMKNTDGILPNSGSIRKFTPFYE